MTRLSLAVIGLSVLILLAGCSTVLDSSPAFETTVESAPDEVAIGEQYNLTLAIENTGGEEGVHTATATIAGETRTRPVTVSPGETTTVTFSHTFTEPGEHNISLVENKTTSVTVVDPIAQALEHEPTAYATSGELRSQLGTMDSEDITTWEARYNPGSKTMNATVYNFGADKNAAPSTERIWFINGTKITKIHDTDFDQTDYSASDYDEWKDARFVSPRSVVEQFEGKPDNVTDTTYAYTATINETDSQKQIMESLGSRFRYHITTDYLETLSVTVQIDKDTHRVSNITVEAYSESSWHSKQTYLSVDYYNYSDSEDITVPDDVMENIDPAEVAIYGDNTSASVIAYSLRFAEEIVVTMNGEERARLQSEYDSTEFTDVSDGDTIVAYAIVNGERERLETHTIGEDSDWS